MSKSVYSLVLSDDVVAAVDRAAYTLGSSRSNLINQILAEYVSFITPEKRRKDIFQSLSEIIGGFEPFQVQSSSDSMLCIRSPLRVKYNPTIKYTVELAGKSHDELGQLKIMTRTQSQSLIELLDEFFRHFALVEKAYVSRIAPQITPQYQIGGGKFIRNFSLLKEGSKTAEIGSAIANYIQMIDKALKECINSEPDNWNAVIVRIYLDYLKETPVIC